MCMHQLISVCSKCLIAPCVQEAFTAMSHAYVHASTHICHAHRIIHMSGCENIWCEHILCPWCVHHPNARHAEEMGAQCKCLVSVCVCTYVYMCVCVCECQCVWVCVRETFPLVYLYFCLSICLCLLCYSSKCETRRRDGCIMRQSAYTCVNSCLPCLQGTCAV